MITVQNDCPPSSSPPVPATESIPEPGLYPPLSSALTSPVPIIAPLPLRSVDSNSTSSPSPSVVPVAVSSPPPLDSNAEASRLPPDSPPPPSDISLDVYVDDENLSSVERIYLLCRSRETMHRVFVSRSLHTLLLDVTPLEAVEYVMPLLSALAIDEEDVVKEALVSNLVSIMWWFFKHCRLVEDEPTGEQQDIPPLPVQSFTPILGSLLIDGNGLISGPARFVVVEILSRLNAADEKNEDNPPFGVNERKILEQEIIHQVIIGMGRLDISDESYPSPSSKPETSVVPSEVPPLLERASPLAAQMGFPFPSSYDPAAHEAERPQTSPVRDIPLGQFSPPLQQNNPFQMSTALMSPPLEGPHEPRVLLPSPPISAVATIGEASATDESSTEWPETSNQEFNDKEQAAIGRLSSMSLIATVTANTKLREDTIRAFADEVAYIGGDSLYWVRREASFAVGALAKVVPMEVLLISLLPLFETLSNDTVWNVRHSAVFALPGILARLPWKQRRSLALKTLSNLAKDESQTVRSGVLEVLGEVIYTFHKDVQGVPVELVNLFVGREHISERYERSMDADNWPREPIMSQTKKPPGTNVLGEHERPEPNTVVITSFAASSIDVPARPLITSFNFPAVALSLGPSRWGEVRDYFFALSHDKNVRVRRTIAAGLGEISRILGGDLAERDLFEIWQDMVHDTDDNQTRLKALSGIPLLVGALVGPAREGLLNALIELWDRWLVGWRERECLATALPALATLAEGREEVVRVLMSKALLDNVAAVREAAVASLTQVLMALENRRPLVADGLRDNLQDLAKAEQCRRRATYISCCSALVKGELGITEISRDEFWVNIDSLSRDVMLDVRIGVARLIGLICEKYFPKFSLRSQQLLEIIRRLTQDPSRDVRTFIARLLMTEVPYPEVASELPSIFYPIFSRPPPRVPSSQDLINGMRELGIPDDLSGMFE